MKQILMLGIIAILVFSACVPPTGFSGDGAASAALPDGYPENEKDLIDLLYAGKTAYVTTTITIKNDLIINDGDIVVTTAAAIGKMAAAPIGVGNLIIQASVTLQKGAGLTVKGDGEVLVEQELAVMDAATVCVGDTASPAAGKGRLHIAANARLNVSGDSALTVTKASRIVLAETSSQLNVQGGLNIVGASAADTMIGDSAGAIIVVPAGGAVNIDTEKLKVGAEVDGSGGISNPDTEATDKAKAQAQPIVAAAPPVLSGVLVTYDTAVTAAFTFNKAVTHSSAAIGSSGAGITPPGGGGTTLTYTVNPAAAALTMDGRVYTLSITAAGDNGKMAAATAQFRAVNGKFTRATAGGPFTVNSYTPAGSVPAVVSLKHSTNQDKLYVVEDAAIVNIFDSVYTPNAGNADVLALFHITIGANVSGSGDKIGIMGTTVPAVTIHIGKPDAGNSALPDFEIPPAGLGNGNSDYTGAILQVNNGAYLNIASDQTWAGAFPSSGSYSAGTQGKLKNGSVYVMAGGKARDGAYKAWPLGEGSVFTVYKGGYLAVGPGTREGIAAAPAGDDSAIGKPVADYYGGWLIGGKVVFDGGATESIQNEHIIVTNNSVLLAGRARVLQQTNIMYDLWLTAGSILTVESQLAFLHGANDNTTVPKAIYGQPQTSGGLGNGNPSEARAASKVIVSAGGSIVSQDTSTNIFGASSGQSISASTTWTATGSTSKGLGPITNYGTFYSSWTMGNP